MIAGIAGAGMYVMKLRSDNAILKANQIKLEEAVESQKEVLAQQKKDFERILNANKELTELNGKLNKDLKLLDDKFNKTNASGKKRDVGDLAIAKRKLIEKIINRATQNAIRCNEIAMGRPLTEKELNATKNSQINPECPSIANPSYVPY